MKEIWRNLDGPPKNKELCSNVIYLNTKTKIQVIMSFIIYNKYCV